MQKKVIPLLVLLSSAVTLAAWWLFAPPGLWGKADAIGYAVCHQIDARSFHLGDHRLPLCARCSGMYLGAAIGLLFLTLRAPRHDGFPDWRSAWPFALAALAFAIDGSNSYLYLVKTTLGRPLPIPNLYVPNNTLRLLTGSGMGLGIAVVLFPAFNQIFWRAPASQPVLNGRTGATLLGLTLLADLLVLTEQPPVLAVAAVVSTLTVPLLLTLIYASAWLFIFRQENQFETLQQGWLPLMAGLTLGMLQILLLDALRLWLTGTWGAFL